MEIKKINSQLGGSTKNVTVYSSTVTFLINSQKSEFGMFFTQVDLWCGSMFIDVWNCHVLYIIKLVLAIGYLPVILSLCMVWEWGVAWWVTLNHTDRRIKQKLCSNTIHTISYTCPNIDHFKWKGTMIRCATWGASIYQILIHYLFFPNSTLHKMSIISSHSLFQEFKKFYCNIYQN